MKFAFIAKHRSIWPVAWLCEALGVSRSGFDAWLHRSPSQHARYDEALLDKIKDSFKDSDRTYGARRVWHDLLAEEFSCGLHRVERVMRNNAMRAKPRRRGFTAASARSSCRMCWTGSSRQQGRTGSGWPILPWTAEGWLYVASIIDLFSCGVVGWSMNANMTAQLVTDALIMAIWRRGKPDALLHHSDQGSQYTSEQFQRVMADHGITCSMSCSGNVWDNAAMEMSGTTPRWKASSHHSNRKGQLARSTEPETMQKQTCSTTSSASTIRSAGIRHWAISARWNLKTKWGLA
jgi:putative transposase